MGEHHTGLEQKAVVKGLNNVFVAVSAWLWNYCTVLFGHVLLGKVMLQVWLLSSKPKLAVTLLNGVVCTLQCYGLDAGFWTA